MSDREIYSHSGSLASLVSDLKNGQRGIDSDSGDWVYKDYSGVIHTARSYKSYSASVWNYNTIPTGLTGSRGLITDASGNIAVSTATATELSYLSGVSSAIQTQLNGKLSGSGNAGRIPYFTSGSALGNSNLYFGGKSIRLMAAPSSWGASFAAIEIGLNAIWANYTVQNGFGLTISSNRYHDGTSNKPYVNGVSCSYEQDYNTHTWACDEGLVAGTMFTPTIRMMLSPVGLSLSSITPSRALVSDANSVVSSSSVTTTELGYLSGVSSSVQTQLNDKVALYGLGIAGRMPYFYSGTQLASSNLYISASRHIGFDKAPAAWGSAYGSIDIGLNAIWGNTNIVDDIPLNISNNRYNDGTNDIPYVSGSSLTFRLYNRTFRWYINTNLTAGVAFSPTQVMMLGISGLQLSTLAASSVVVNNSSGYLASSSVTPTELGYLSGVSSSVQTQLNGKLSGSGTTGLIPYFTSSGAVGGSKCEYSPSLEQFMWYTSANSELMRLVNEYLWLNTKLVCNGVSTGDTGYIFTSTSNHTIDVGALTQQNIKINSSTSATTLYLYKARVGTLIYLTNIGSTQINVSYDKETSGPKHALYPGQTMQLLCVNIYGAGSQSCTWAIWRTDVYAGAHLDD